MNKPPFEVGDRVIHKNFRGWGAFIVMEIRHEDKMMDGFIYQGQSEYWFRRDKESPIDYDYWYACDIFEKFTPVATLGI